MNKQSKETVRKKMRRGAPFVRMTDEQPLLAWLVRESHRRSDTLASLAQALGVSYARLAQWRRNESLIRNAKRTVLESAARYLGLPTLYVLIQADIVQLADFVWPGKKSVDDLVAEQIVRMQQDRKIGPFVPAELGSAAPSVRMLLAFVFHELEQCSQNGVPQGAWLEELRRAAAAHLHGTQSGLAEVVKASPVKK